MVRATLRELAPSFANPEQRAFFDCRAPEVLYSGWMGAGKSRIICEKVWHLARRYPGATFGIFRKVAASLNATTVRTFFRDVAEPRFITARHRTESWVEVAPIDGGESARIYFMGLDPDPITGVPSKVGSLDLACAYVDEAIEVGEGDWIMLQGRLRDPRMPWHQLGGATNPAGPTHWLKRRFTPGRAERVYLTATRNDFLPEDYKARLADLPDNVHGQRLGRGLWVAAEGAIYILPDEQVRRPEPGAVWHQVVAGIDWGYSHNFACEIVARSGSGRMAVLGELYQRGRLLEDLLPALLAIQSRLKVAAFYADPSEPEYIATCQRAGLAVTPAINDVLPGIDAVSTAIGAGLTVDPSCRGLLAELPNYHWAPERATGGLRDQPTKLDDDACDALRYAVMGLSSGGVALYV